MTFAKEFRDFVMRGNVVDMAVGVVIGAAFGKIVTSLVEDIFLPVVGTITGKIDFSTLAAKVYDPTTNNVLVTIPYGKFINAVVAFLIVAFCLFMVIKAMNAMTRKSADAPPPPAPPTKEQELLAEIRDLLQNQARKA
ncbi:MAG: large-conductance mechanosensitive channel protein MscL [Planctomycetia bacterium]|nr:large-conductance mechanosensitive channel protein MscL [Planctomycetia bacterium]